MKEIHYRAIEKMPITIEVMNMISVLHEYKGRQELYIETQPEILDKLMEVARIQSTEASNKIEGIYTSDKRLKEIVQKKSEPRNRNEKEIAGYREVLGMIHDSYSYIQLKPNDILTLHKYLYSYSETSNGGHYKMVDNYIEEEDEFGNKSVRFQPIPAKPLNLQMPALTFLPFPLDLRLPAPLRFLAHPLPYRRRFPSALTERGAPGYRERKEEPQGPKEKSQG